MATAQVIAGIVAIGGLATASTVLTGTPAPSGTIVACVGKVTGNLRAIVNYSPAL